MLMAVENITKRLLLHSYLKEGVPDSNNKSGFN